MNKDHASGIVESSMQCADGQMSDYVRWSSNLTQRFGICLHMSA